MADTLNPSDRLTLHGLAAVDRPSNTPSQAVLLKLSNTLLQDVRKAAATPNGVQLVTGTAPRLRLGKRTIDLTISPEAFEQELFSASKDVLGDFHLASFITHCAEVKAPARKPSAGPDAALAALKDSLASYEQEKQAKSTNITNTVLPVPQSRFDAARAEKKARRRGLLPQATYPSSSSSGKASANAVPRSVPTSDTAARQRAMRVPIIHLLAIKPHTRQEIQEKTRIPKEELEDILGRVGREERGKWQLVDRSFKDLDVWSFGYPSPNDRKAAIDNAIRAYDRLRIGKEDKLWQLLLSKDERGKGIVLSKLHLGGATAANRGLTPNHGGSPLSNTDAHGEVKEQSAANTPRLGPASTPRTGAAKTDATSGLNKRLFAKDPKKARAAEEAKDKKRKAKESVTAAGDKDVEKPARKKQATKANNPKVKSAEIVEDSSDESGEEGEVKETPTSQSLQSQSMATSGSVIPTAASKLPGAQKSTALSARASDATAKPSAGKLTKPRTSLTGTPKPSVTPATVDKPASSKLSKPSTNAAKPASAGLSAPVSSQSRTHPSPPKTDSKPLIPSSLGATRPRIMSDVSDRAAVGVQRVRNGTDPASKSTGNGAAVRKRHDTVTSTDSMAPVSPESRMKDRKAMAPTIARKSVPGPGTGATPSRGETSTAGFGGSSVKSSSTLKRKQHDAATSRSPEPATAKIRRVDMPSRASNVTNKTTDVSVGRATASQKPGPTSSPRNGKGPSTGNGPLAASANARHAAAASSRASASGPAQHATSSSGRSSISSLSGNSASSRSSRSDSSSSSSVPLLEAAHGRSSNSATTASTTNNKKPNHSPPSPSVSSSNTVRDLSYSQGLRLAKRFEEEYYPKYATMYDEQAACFSRGEEVDAEQRATLLKMHRRLEVMKKEIAIADAKNE